MTARIDPTDLLLELVAAVYRPGDELSGAFSLPESALAVARSIELSVLWQGKGSSIPSVAHHEGWNADDTLARLVLPHAFRVKLPKMPWSYEGKSISIRWLVRVRFRYCESANRVGEIVREIPFAMSPIGEAARPICGSEGIESGTGAIGPGTFELRSEPVRVE